MLRQFLDNIRPALLALAVFTLLLGVLYPLVETGIGQAFFNFKANGQITANGSNRIGQNWTGPQWFHTRPDTNDPMATGGTNLGPRSKTLKQDTQKQVAKLKKEGVKPTNGLTTTSGSGVDPDISPTDAYAQVDMVAKARGLSPARVRALVTANIQGPEFGFLGDQYVDVLLLNEALAKLS